MNAGKVHLNTKLDMIIHSYYNRFDYLRPFVLTVLV